MICHWSMTSWKSELWPPSAFKLERCGLGEIKMKWIGISEYLSVAVAKKSSLQLAYLPWPEWESRRNWLAPGRDPNVYETFGCLRQTGSLIGYAQYPPFVDWPKNNASCSSVLVVLVDNVARSSWFDSLLEESKPKNRLFDISFSVTLRR